MRRLLPWGLATLPPSKATADSPPQRLPNCTGCSKCLSEGNSVIEKDAKKSLAQQKLPEVRQQDKCLRQKNTEEATYHRDQISLLPAHVCVFVFSYWALVSVLVC